MGKGAILKGKTKENIYPVSSSDLVFDPVTKKSVKVDLGTKVEEAPKDDKQYARVNGAWAEVEAGAVSETVLITLTPANTELYGVPVRVTTSEGDAILDTTWQGAQLSVQVRAGLQYTVAVGDKDGFITPESVTYTAVKGASRSVNMAYIASKLTVNILSNQANDTAISGVKATVTYGSTSVQVANGGSVNLPLNTSVTITFPAVAGYKTPDAITYDHTSGNYEKSGTYQTEVVKVTLSADNGANVSGQVVTINGTQHTWNGTEISQKVAYGTQYTVTANDIDGFTTPASQTFTAGQATRSVSMVYEEVKYNVFILGQRKSLYTIADWISSGAANPVGLAIRDENNRVVCMSLYENTTGGKCSYSNVRGETLTDAYGKDSIEEILEANAFEEAIALSQIFNNNRSTFEDFAQEEENGEIVYDYNFYIPYATELKLFFDNIEEVNSVISQLSSHVGVNFPILNGEYWSCTPLEGLSAWMVGTGSSGAYITSAPKTNDYNLRTFIEYI